MNSTQGYTGETVIPPSDEQSIFFLYILDLGDVLPSFEYKQLRRIGNLDIPDEMYNLVRKPKKAYSAKVLNGKFREVYFALTKNRELIIQVEGNEPYIARSNDDVRDYLVDNGFPELEEPGGLEEKVSEDKKENIEELIPAA